MAKGGQFERDLCRTLSIWWCGADDAFWRSSQSGGRATVRRRKGKATRGHAGDIAATDSEGEPLVKCITVEAKVGYYDADVCRMFDKPGKCGKTWAGWFAQAQAAANNAGSPYWVIIHLRNKKGASHAPVIVVPDALFAALLSVGCELNRREHLALAAITVVRLEDFLKVVDPQDVRTLLAVHRSKT